MDAVLAVLHEMLSQTGVYRVFYRPDHVRVGRLPVPDMEREIER